MSALLTMAVVATVGLSIGVVAVLLTPPWPQVRREPPLDDEATALVLLGRRPADIDAARLESRRAEWARTSPQVRPPVPPSTLD